MEIPVTPVWCSAVKGDGMPFVVTDAVIIHPRVVTVRFKFMHVATRLEV